MRLECRECGESFVGNVDGLSWSELKKALRNYDFFVCDSCLLDEDEDDWWEEKSTENLTAPSP